MKMGAHVMKSVFKCARTTFCRYDFLYPIIFCLPLILKLAPLDLVAVGGDTRTHVYKAYVLTEQIKQLPPALWGSWDWNWYCGYPFLKLYSPMSYYVFAFFSLMLNCSIEYVVYLMILASFPLSALSMYLLTKHLTKNILVSIVASSTYTYVPFHIANSTICGNPASILAFVFIPLVLLFAEKFTETPKAHYMILSSLFLTLVILSNHAYGASCTVVFVAWLFFRKKVFQAFVLTSVTVLLSAFFLFPLVFFSSIASSTFLPMQAQDDPITSIAKMVLPTNGLSIGLTPFVAGILLSLLKLASFLRNHNRLKRVKPLLSRIDSRLIISGILLLLICLYNLLIYLFPTPPFSALSYGRTAPPALLLLSLFIAFVAMTLKRGRMVIGPIIILLAIIDGMATPVYYPLQPQRYHRAFEYLKNDTEWFRVLFVPSEPLGSLIPLYAGKPIVDGWFVQGHTPELLRILEIADEELVDNPNKTLTLLRYLGVKYIVVESMDPVYPPDYSMKLYEATTSSTITQEVFADQSVKVLKLKDYVPVIVSNQIREITRIEEFYEIIDKVDNNTIFILESHGYNPDSTSETEKQVGLIIDNITQNTRKLTISIYVNCSSYVLIPVSYSPSLSVNVNEHEVVPLKVVPSFICVQLPTAGDYALDISIRATPIDFYATLTSLIGLIGLVAASGLISSRSFWKKKGVNTRYQ